MFIRKLMKLYIFHHKFKKTMEILKSIDYVDKHPTGAITLESNIDCIITQPVFK